MKLRRKIAAAMAAGAVMMANAAPVLTAAEVKEMQTGALSEETVQFYSYWKEKYLAQDPYVTGDPQYYVFYGEKTYAEAGAEVAVTVSEAHGYGMLIAASMAEHDSQAKDIFDGMYRYYKAHPSSIGPNLMAWQQTDNGSAIQNSAGADSATDGDLDIAYALLMADTVWGSDGAINYKQAALAVMEDIMTYEVNQTDWVLQLGDWAHNTREGDTYYAATRSSDYIVQYMPVFAEASGDTRWTTLYESTYRIINQMVDTYGTGILPDFIVKDSNGKFVPASANLLESEHDGNFYYNACRTPWRISMDYLVNGNADALKFANALNGFITRKTGGDPAQIMAGYTPAGEAVFDWNDLCFDAPFLVAAACGGYDTWHNSLRSMILDYGEDVYFGDTITMLCLIVDDNAWIVPTGADQPVRGDVNQDGACTAADVIALQKWLLHTPDASLADWKAGDLCPDGKLNAMGLCLLKWERLNPA